MKGYYASSRLSLNDLTRASSPAHSALTVDLEKLAPHSSSMIAVTWRVDTRDLACRHALYDHFHPQRQHERLLTPLIAETISVEKLPSPRLQHPQRHQPNARVERASTRPIAVPRPIFRPFVQLTLFLNVVLPLEPGIFSAQPGGSHFFRCDVSAARPVELAFCPSPSLSPVFTV